MPPEPERDEWKHGFAGGIGGICNVIVGHPFDTVKVRIQASRKDATSVSQSELVSPLFVPSAATTHTARAEPVIAGTRHRLRAVNDKARRPGAPHPHLQRSRDRLASVPDPIQTAGSKTWQLSLSCQLICVAAGVRGLFRGVLLPAVGVFPLFTIYFGAYEWSCARLRAARGSELTVLESALCGIPAGLASLNDGWLSWRPL